MAQTYLCCGDHPPCTTCLPCEKVAGGYHPDVITYGNLDQGIPVDDVRRLGQDAYILPNEGRCKVFLLLANPMTPQAQNALLKLIEEGPSHAAFLLLTQQEGVFLPTLRSRCQPLHLGEVEGIPPTPEELLRSETLARLLLEQDQLNLFTFLSPYEKLSREEIRRFFSLTTQILHEDSGLGSTKARLFAIDTLTKLQSSLTFNVGVGHLFGALVVMSTQGTPRPN